MQIAITNFSQIDKKIFRLEAEFYVSNSLLNIECFTGEDIIDFVQYGTSKELNESQNGFPILRLNEFDSLFIGKPNKYCEKIDINTYNSLSLKKGDVLVCRTNGNPKLVGKSAIVPKDSNYAYASYLFRIRPHYDKILPTTLTIYLNSKIGRAEIEKHLMVSNQANFSPAKFREILVPKFGNEIQKIIDKNVWKAFQTYEQSKASYQQAQNLLLAELGLNEWQPKHELCFIKNYSDTVEAERMDAEYFQPKYDDIINAIKSYKGGWDRLGNLVNIKKSIEVGSEQYLDEGIPFVRVSNLSTFAITEEKYISNELYQKLLSAHQPKKDEILLSKDGTAGIAHHLVIPPKFRFALQ